MSREPADLSTQLMVGRYAWVRRERIARGWFDRPTAKRRAARLALAVLGRDAPSLAQAWREGCAREPVFQGNDKWGEFLDQRP